jgi:SAM-dependent methyltransferase
MSRVGRLHPLVAPPGDLSWPDERLGETAPLQLRLAERWCDDSCRWYHGPRGYLRALRIHRGMRKDSEFMTDAMVKEATRLGPSRVLISGAADCATLAHVAAAYASAGQPFRATIVDRCRTPLDVNAWYARKTGLDVSVAHADMLRYGGTRTFDLVVTHSFFSFFDDRSRLRLMRTWRRLLRPGGSVVTAHGIYRSKAALEAADAERTRIYLKRVREIDDGACRQLGIDRPTLMGWVETGNTRRSHRRVSSVAAFRRLFEDHGFRITSFMVEDVTVVEGIRRVGVVAERLG